MRKNVINGCLSTKKLNLKELCDKHDLINGLDYFILKSPAVNGVMIVADARITQDTTPMLKIEIKRVEVIQPKGAA
jgi:hypothetical protein